MRIAFLGLGKMGVPIVDVLLRAGHYVTVWNRTPKSLAQLGLARAHLVDSVSQAVERCDVAFTMLADDAATESVVFSEDGILAALPKKSIHVSLATISVALSDRLEASHTEAGQCYVAAPVFGRPHVAAQGNLWILAAGDADTIERIRMLLAAIGRGLTIVGKKPSQANAAKLAGNMLLSSMLQSLSEAFVFTSTLGLDPEAFLKTVNEALFQSPFFLNYGRFLLHAPAQPGATVELGAKDARLFREAANAAGLHFGLAAYLQQQLNSAVEEGMGQMDWAVGQYRIAEKTAKLADSE